MRDIVCIFISYETECAYNCNCNTILGQFFFYYLFTFFKNYEYNAINVLFYSVFSRYFLYYNNVFNGFIEYIDRITDYFRELIFIIGKTHRVYAAVIIMRVYYYEPLNTKPYNVV